MFLLGFRESIDVIVRLFCLALLVGKSLELFTFKHVGIMVNHEKQLISIWLLIVSQCEFRGVDLLFLGTNWLEFVLFVMYL